MTALSLTPRPSIMAVTLEVSGAPAGAVTITRHDRNGSAAVRLYVDQAPVAGALTVVDYEAALTGALVYDVLDSAGVTTTASTALDLEALAVLTVIGRPNRRAELEGVTDVDEQLDGRSTVVDPIDRDDPVVILRPLTTRRGTLDLYASSHAKALEAVNVARSGLPILFRQSSHDGLDLLAAPRSARVASRVLDGRVTWAATIAYVEVRDPASPLLAAAGWSVEQLAATFATVADVAAAFSSVADLTAGP